MNRSLLGRLRSLIAPAPLDPMKMEALVAVNAAGWHTSDGATHTIRLVKFKGEVRAPTADLYAALRPFPEELTSGAREIARERMRPPAVIRLPIYLGPGTQPGSVRAAICDTARIADVVELGAYWGCTPRAIYLLEFLEPTLERMHFT